MNRPRPTFRKVLKFLGFGLLAVLLVAVAGLAYMWWRIPEDNLDPMEPGRLAVANSAKGTFQAGPFAVKVDAGEKGFIEVTRNGNFVWRSAPGVAFASASQSAPVQYPEHFGYFWPQIDRKSRLTEQRLEKVTTQGNKVVLTGTLSGEGSSAPFTLTLEPRQRTAEVTTLHLDLAVKDVSSVMLTARRDGTEKVHGFGEQYAPFDRNGSVIPILPREQGIGRGDQPLSFLADLTKWAAGDHTTSYAPWPAYITSANRAFTMDNTDASGALVIADLSRANQISLESWSGEIKGEAVAGNSPAEVIKARSAGVQRPPLAGWTQDGAILGLQGGTDRVKKIVNDMLAAGTPIKAVWLQDWTGKRTTSFGDRLWWTWQLDQTRYPGWDQMVADFNAKGIKVLTYINTWLVDAAERGDAGGRNLFREAEAKGYLVKRDDGKPYQMDQNGFDATLVDLTNPAARDWYAGIIATEVLGKGADGFMADFGEALPYDGQLEQGKATEQHNRWPFLWASTVREGCKRAGKPDCVTFMRSAYLGSDTQTPLMWAGDQMVTYSDGDGMASAIHGINAGGVSGLPLWHTDIGGYTSLNAVVKDYVRSKDLNQRWTEMAAFGVVMRTHEGNRPALNAQIYDSGESRAAFAKMVKLFVALKPYRETVIKEAIETGMPAQRHSWLVYPGSKAEGADDQFFLGAHLLVAPVLADDTDEVTITFPPGKWTNILTGQTFAGDTTSVVKAPLGTPAAFVRDGDPVGTQIISAVKAAGIQ